MEPNILDPTTPQSVSCRLLAAKARVRPRSKQCGIYGVQSMTGTSFLFEKLGSLLFIITKY